MFYGKILAGLKNSQEESKREFEVSFGLGLKNIPTGVCAIVCAEPLANEEVQSLCERLDKKKPLDHSTLTKEDFKKFAEDLYEKLKVEELIKNSFEGQADRDRARGVLVSWFFEKAPQWCVQDQIGLYKALAKLGAYCDECVEKMRALEMDVRVFDGAKNAWAITMEKIIEKPLVHFSDLEKPGQKIIVGNEILPKDVSLLSSPQYNVVGFFNEKYPGTSHAAIEAGQKKKVFAQIKDISTLVSTGDRVVFDYDRAIFNPTRKTLSRIQAQEKKRTIDQRVHAYNAEQLLLLPAVTRDMVPVEISGKILGVEDALRAGFEKRNIGFVSTEQGYASGKDYTAKFLQIMMHYSQGVIFRILDKQKDKSLGADIDEALAQEGVDSWSPKQESLRFLLETAIGQKLFKKQAEELSAAMLAAGNSNVYITIPMVSSEEEYIKAKKVLTEAGVPKDKIGITAETPEICNEELLQKINPAIIQVGATDLLRYTKKVAREHITDILQASVDTADFLKNIAKLVRYAKKAYGKAFAKKFIFCGEVITYPLFKKVALGLGCRNFALPATIEDVGAATIFIRHLWQKDCVLLAKKLLEGKDPEERREYLRIENSGARDWYEKAQGVVSSIKLNTMYQEYEADNAAVQERVSTVFFPALKKLRKALQQTWRKDSEKHLHDLIVDEAAAFGELLGKNVWKYSGVETYVFDENGASLLEKKLGSGKRYLIHEVASFFAEFLPKQTLTFLDAEKNIAVYGFSPSAGRASEAMVLAIKDLRVFFKMIAQDKGFSEEEALGWWKKYLESQKKIYNAAQGDEAGTEISDAYFLSKVFVRLPALHWPDKQIIFEFDNISKSIERKAEHSAFPKSLIGNKEFAQQIFYKNIIDEASAHISEQMEILADEIVILSGKKKLNVLAEKLAAQNEFDRQHVAKISFDKQWLKTALWQDEVFSDLMHALDRGGDASTRRTIFKHLRRELTEAQFEIAEGQSTSALVKTIEQVVFKKLFSAEPIAQYLLVKKGETILAEQGYSSTAAEQEHESRRFFAAEKFLQQEGQATPQARVCLKESKKLVNLMYEGGPLKEEDLESGGVWWQLPLENAEDIGVLAFEPVSKEKEALKLDKEKTVWVYKKVPQKDASAPPALSAVQISGNALFYTVLQEESFKEAASMVSFMFKRLEDHVGRYLEKEAKIFLEKQRDKSVAFINKFDKAVNALAATSCRETDIDELLMDWFKKYFEENQLFEFAPSIVKIDRALNQEALRLEDYGLKLADFEKEPMKRLFFAAKGLPEPFKKEGSHISLQRVSAEGKINYDRRELLFLTKSSHPQGDIIKKIHLSFAEKPGELPMPALTELLWLLHNMARIVLFAKRDRVLRNHIKVLFNSLQKTGEPLDKIISLLEETGKQ